MKQINESQKHIARIHHVNMERSGPTRHMPNKKKNERKRTTFKETMQYDLHIAENPMVVHVHVLDRIKWWIDMLAKISVQCCVTVKRITEEKVHKQK